MTRGKLIVLTAPFTEMIDHAGYFIQMGMASLPAWMEGVVDRKYPRWKDVKRFDSRVALVTTAGLVPKGQPPFDQRIKGGDCSYRVISGDADVPSLGEFHRSQSFDHAGIAQDRNVAFPLDRLRELALDGEIGEVAPRHASFMGSITAPGRLMRNTAPEAARLLVENNVDIALLVPV